MDYYNFETPVTNDLTLTAVWNDIVDPKNPTLANLYKAMSLGIAEQHYPVGTEIPHIDTGNKTNPWVVLHYTTIPVPEGGDVVNRQGAILGLKFVDAQSYSWSSTTANSYYIPLECATIFAKLPEEERFFFSTIQHEVLGAVDLFFPTQQNLTSGSSTVWDYYNDKARLFLHAAWLATLSSATDAAFSSDRICATATNLSHMVYCSGITAPSTVNFATRAVSTTTTCYPKYCVFMKSPLQQAESESS